MKFRLSWCVCVPFSHKHRRYFCFLFKFDARMNRKWIYKLIITAYNGNNDFSMKLTSHTRLHQRNLPICAVIHFRIQKEIYFILGVFEKAEHQKLVDISCKVTRQLLVKSNLMKVRVRQHSGILGKNRVDRRRVKVSI